ncbi:MAG: thioredoxin family protein [Bacteroidetes bacterium]|nr:thioredoxin family protein [Bacteroidota bacterium]
MSRIFSLLAGMILLTVNSPAQELVKVENFTLEDVTGKKHSLADYKGSKAIVVMFIATQCPVSNDYNERMATIEKDYRGKGITFLGVNSNKQESVEEIREHAAKHGFAFPVLKDHKNVIADRFKASFTPEVYVLSGSFDILYHGRIDDSQRLAKVTVKDLRVTLDEILAGKPVTTPRTKAFGCTIKRVS